MAGKDKTSSTQQTDSPRLSRRDALKLTSAASVPLLAGCTGIGGGGDSSDTLSVAVWSGTYADSFKETVKPMYEEETGTTLQVTTGWADLLSKIKSAPEDNPPFDVTAACCGMYERGVSEGLFQELRLENVPAMDNVYPYLKNFRGHDYGAPVDGAPAAIMYSDQLGWEPTQWSDLLRDAPLGMDGGFYIFPVSIAALILEDMPGIEEIYDGDSHEAVFNKLSEMSVDSWYSSGAERWQDIVQGTVNISQSYFGVSKRKAQEEDGVSVMMPDRTSAWFGHYCVVRGSEKRDQAENFINFLLREDVQSPWAQNSFNLMANQNVQYPDATADAYPQSNEEYQSIKFPDYSYVNENSGTLNNKFQQVKQSS